jgi:hypothetical protein
MSETLPQPPGKPAPAPDGPVVKRRHRHTAFETHGHTVHIDVVGGTHYGPGSSYHLVMAYRDGFVPDQDMSGGSSIGCGAGNPTIIVSPTRAIQVDNRPDSRKPVPEVWMVNLEAVHSSPPDQPVR